MSEQPGHPSLLIIYATVTGNAKSCARDIADFARRAGYSAQVRNVDGIKIDDLTRERAIVFAVSTYGDGGPPVHAEPFWKELCAFKGSLGQLSYGIYALGDSSFAEFCGFGRKLDRELRARGATPLTDLVENDAAFDAGLQAFCTSFFAALSHAIARTSR